MFVRHFEAYLAVHLEGVPNEDAPPQHETIEEVRAESARGIPADVVRGHAGCGGGNGAKEVRARSRIVSAH